MSLWANLKNRQLVQWTMAYLAGAWMVWQVMDVLGERWGLTPGLGRSLDVLLIAGLFATLILAWYHGEKGRQKVSGPELLLMGGLFGLTAAVFAVLGARSGGIDQVDNVEDARVATVLRYRPAIAVLPFRNMSTQEENEYFTQGIHDDLLTQLSKIGALDVIARTSVMQYAGTEKTIPQIGEELGVETVVEGGVQRIGNRIRINVQLIRANTNTHLWADTYDRELSAENIFEIQSEIALQIADELSATLTPEEGSRIGTVATGSLTALDFFIRGQDAYNRFTVADNDEAVRLFREALEVDSVYARAWAGLGDAFGRRILSQGGGALPASFAIAGRSVGSGVGVNWADSAIAAGRRATDIDPELADGYAALGFGHARRGEAEDARENYLQALRLDPSHIAAVSRLGDLYFRLGEFEEFHRWSRRAFHLDPNYPLRRTQVAWSYWNFEEYDLTAQWARRAVVLGVDVGEALTVLSAASSFRGDFARGMEIADSIVDNFPASSYNYTTAAWAALYGRDFERALPLAEEAFRLDPTRVDHHWHYPITTLGFTLLRTGDTERGMELLAEAYSRTQAILERDTSWTPVWEMASIHAARGEMEEAIEWAERAYASTNYWFPRFIELDPIFDGVRDDPRFRDLVANMTGDVMAARSRIEREEIQAGIR